MARLTTRRLLLLVALAATFAAARAEAVPQLISYQGQLNNAAGVPVSGTVSFVFSLYDVPTGGTALWTEAQTVSVSNGIFNVQLGAVQPLPAPLFLKETLYLGIRVGTDAEMTPRQRLTSSAYSRHTEVADALVGGILPGNLLAGLLPQTDPGLEITALSNFVDGSGLTSGYLGKGSCNVCSFNTTYDLGAVRTADISIDAIITRQGSTDLAEARWWFLSSIDGTTWSQLAHYPGASGQTDRVNRTWLRIPLRYFRIVLYIQSWRGGRSDIEVNEIVIEEKR